MSLTFLLNNIFSRRNLGAVEVDANTTALDYALKNSGSAIEILLGAAEVTIGILEYFNRNIAPKIGTDAINFAQLLINVDKAMEERKTGPVSGPTQAAITAEISGLLASTTQLVYSKTRYAPLAGVYALFKAVEIAATYASTMLPDANQLRAELEQRQREIIGIFDTQVSERTAQVTSIYESRLTSYAELLGISKEVLLQKLNPNSGSGFDSDMEGFVDEARARIQRQIDASLELRIDYSVAELEAYKDKELGEFNWITGDYGNGGTLSGVLSIHLEQNLKELTNFMLDELSKDILANTHDDTLNTINAQLAGIIDGYSHIDEADKAAILAGWQQKFAGEFALERNGSDALLLDEIARLKAEMGWSSITTNCSQAKTPPPMEVVIAQAELACIVALFNACSFVNNQ